MTLENSPAWFDMSNRSMLAPVADCESARLTALQGWEILDTPAEPEFDRITRLAAALFDVPISLISFVDESRQWFKSRLGLNVEGTSRDISFCSWTIPEDGLLVVEDALEDERYRANPLVTGDPHMRFYAGAPLTMPGGLNVGVLCLIDRVPRSLTPQQRNVLAELAATTSTLLEWRLAERRQREAAAAIARDQARYRSVVDNLKEVVFQTDSEGLWTFLNPAWREISGFPVESSLGQPLLNFVHPDDRERNLGLFQPLIERKKEYCRHTVRYLTADGGSRWIDVFARLTLDQEDRIVGTSGTLNDVHDRILADEEASKARDAAEKANQAKNEFLSRVSHELRTPMNSILGFAQLLEFDELSESQSESVERILRAGRHLLSLLNDILDISRIESGRLSLELQPVGLSLAVTEALEMVRPLAAPMGVEIVLADDFRGQSIVADRGRLAQVLINLLNNAVKYNRSGGQVRVECRTKDARYMRVSIADTGPGIPAGRLGRLFQPFQRLGAERTRVEGTGLGLALSKNLTEMMGGRIGVESTPGEGSVFWVDLPLAADLGSARVKTAPEARVRHILYIDDVEANIRLAERILGHRQGLRLIPALRGEVGLQVAREIVPDLILLDLHLPDISGSEVLDRLQEFPATAAIPVIVITADVLPATRRAVMERGACEYLTKPVDVKQLLASVDRVLNPESATL